MHVRGPPFGIVAVCMYSCSFSKKIKNEISTSPTILQRVKSFQSRPLSLGREGVRACEPTTHPNRYVGSTLLSLRRTSATYCLILLCTVGLDRYRNQSKFGLGWEPPSTNHAASSIRTVKWTGSWSSLQERMTYCLLFLLSNSRHVSLGTYV